MTTEEVCTAVRDALDNCKMSDAWHVLATSVLKAIERTPGEEQNVCAADQ